MRASQAAASRLSGDRDPGGTGAGPSLSELQSERSAVPGSSGSSRNTQPTASARKPAHAEPRHSAMWTHCRTGDYRILSRLAPPPSWARADVPRGTSHPRATGSSSRWAELLNCCPSYGWSYRWARQGGGRWGFTHFTFWRPRWAVLLCGSDLG